jgi:hypothetical protein
MALVLLISGWAHSGKDTVAKILVESYDFQKYAFADAIKKQVAKEQDIPLEWCYDQERKSEALPGDPSKTLREELIRVGEEGRAKDKGFWAEQIAQKIKKCILKGKEKFVISDWRNLEELFTLQKELPGATIIPLRIERPSQLISPVPDWTEYSLLGFPFWKIISNSGTIVRLICQVENLIECDMPKVWKSRVE